MEKRATLWAGCGNLGCVRFGMKQGFVFFSGQGVGAWTKAGCGGLGWG